MKIKRIDKQEVQNIFEFLKIHGWERIDNDSDYYHFEKDVNMSSIDIDTDFGEILFVNNWGLWLHIPLNFYALIGALLHYRMLPVNYIFDRKWE